MSETALTVFQSLKAPATYQDLITDTSQKIRLFAAQYGEDALKEVLVITLSTLSEGLGLPVSGSMLSDASDLIIQEWPDTKLSDFLLFKKEMLLGRIGGQVDDKLWKWNTRSITQAWGEYYAKREDVFCDYREQKHREDKSAYENGLGKAFASASDETKKSIADNVIRLSLKKTDDSIKPTFRGKMSLDEIAESQGLDKTELAEAMLEANRTEYADKQNNHLTFEVFCILMAPVHLNHARNNPNYLKSLLNGI